MRGSFPFFPEIDKVREKKRESKTRRRERNCKEIKGKDDVNKEVKKNNEERRA